MTARQRKIPLIREAAAADTEAISKLVTGVALAYILPDLSARGADSLTATMTPGAIGQFMADGMRYHLAEVDGSLAGVVGVRDNSHLYHLFVAEKFHRQGIARRLWRTAMQCCLGQGNPGHFTVNSSEYAQGVYEKLGFVAQSGPQQKNGVIFIPMTLTGNDPAGP